MHNEKTSGAKKKAKAAKKVAPEESTVSVRLDIPASLHLEMRIAALRCRQTNLEFIKSAVAAAIKESNRK